MQKNFYQGKVGNEVSPDDVLLSFSNFFVVVVFAKFFQLFLYQVIVKILRGTQLEESLIIIKVDPDEPESKKCFIHVIVLQYPLEINFTYKLGWLNLNIIKIILYYTFFITLSLVMKIINENCDHILKFDIDMITVIILI